MNTIIEHRRKFHKTMCLIVLLAAIAAESFFMRRVPALAVTCDALILFLWIIAARWWMNHEICPSSTIVISSDPQEKEKSKAWAENHPHDFGYLFYAEDEAKAADLIRLYRIPQVLVSADNSEQQMARRLSDEYGMTIKIYKD